MLTTLVETVSEGQLPIEGLTSGRYTLLAVVRHLG